MDIADAKASARLAKIMQRDQDGRARVVYVPWHEGKTYQVIFWRSGHQLRAECNVLTAIGSIPCAIAKKTCEHIVSAVIHMAEDSGFRIIIARDHACATRLSRLYRHSEVIEIHKRDADLDDSVWAVVQPTIHK